MKTLIKRTLGAALLLTTCATASIASTIHVTTDGNDSNNGSADNPLLTIHKAVDICQPGDTIFVHAGTYLISERIKIPEKATSADRRCYLWAYPGDEGKVIIDGSAMHHTVMQDFKMGRCIYVNHLANYWYFKGLVLQNAEDNGMKVEGSYNIIERCTFRYNNDTGLQIGMYKDFTIEETKALPISGTPEFNPNYTYCKYNKVINCDSYENHDGRNYDGSADDGGDADGFACKLFPGPGTEFHGCRAWTNSDDNWDLYMVYHPVVIDHCWAYNAGYDSTGKAVGNGNGFKLGGGGTAGGAAFSQSTGAHVVTNCVSFKNYKKGFDQNNAYEGMYIFNCTAWGNDFNYRFPTVFMYGDMQIRNCIGWGAVTANHEFLSEDKEGSVVPDTEYNSWTTLDGCNPYKEGAKVDGTKVYTKDYSSEFLSLSVEDFMAERQSDGSLPDNNFARLKPTSQFKDLGTPIVGVTPKRHLTEAQAEEVGLELITADDVYIPYNDVAPEFGAYELDGTPAAIVIPEKCTLVCSTANSRQDVIEGNAIEDIVFRMGGAATAAEVEGLGEGMTYAIDGDVITISGTPAVSTSFTITVNGDASLGVKPLSASGSITVNKPYKVLTGDWYHFQDAWEDIPADLKNVFSLIDGTTVTVLDTAKTESDGAIPAGCTKGGIDMGKGGGGVKWTLPNGAMQLLLNLHFTGGRTFNINWTLDDGTTGTFTTAKLSKGTYAKWDILKQAGIADGTKLRSIEILNALSSGGVRLYDMYVRVPDVADAISTSSIREVTTAPAVLKFMTNGRILISKNAKTMNTIGQEVK